jgi:V8-like Glu-specific endopeptidase
VEHITSEGTCVENTNEGVPGLDGLRTRYELIGHIDFNVTDLDTDCSAPGPAGVSASQGDVEGIQGLEFDRPDAQAPKAPEFVRDAVHGSYHLPAVQEVIIGSDDRIRVTATGLYPWRAICALRITAANGATYIGTGWFVSPRTVITAGHCVFLHNEGGWARSIEVIPALNDASRPYGSATSSALRSVTGWTQSRNRNNDYGAIILPENSRLGERVGTFGYSSRPDDFLKTARLNLSGYPSDKGGNQQWFMAQGAKSVTSRVISYEIDTVGGQSGAPVWVLLDGKRYAVGIHTYGDAAGNSATRIESTVFQRITDWAALGN